MNIKAKICGLTTTEAVIAAQDNAADFLGFVFYPPSPRNISPEDSAELGEIANVAKVAVVVDADDKLLSDIIVNLQPDYIQLHGEETEERAKEIKKKFDIPLIRSCEPNIYPESDLYDFLLVDPSHGHGKTFDWKNFTPPTVPYFLSGGLNISNIEQAIVQTGASMIDVSSGVEVKRGVKDVSLIKELLDKVKN